MALPPAWCAPYIGLPYVPGGRSADAVDCWGILVLVCRQQFGREVPVYDGVFWDKGCDRVALGDFMAVESPKSWVKIPLSEAVPGDGIQFNMMGEPIHVGVIVADGLMLHCERGKNSCVEDFNSIRWRNRIAGAFRFEVLHA